MLGDVRFAQTNKIGPCLHLPCSENNAAVWIVTIGRQMHQMGPHAPAIPPRNKNRPVYTGASPEITVFAPTQSPLQASTSPIHARSPTQDASPPAILCSAPPNATVPQTVDIPQSASSLQDASHIPPPCGLPIPSPNLSETTRDENAFSRMSVRSLRFSDDRGSLSDSSQSSLQQGASTWQRLGGSFEGRSRVPEGAYTIYAPAPPSVVRSVPRHSSRSHTSGSTFRPRWILHNDKELNGLCDHERSYGSRGHKCLVHAVFSTALFRASSAKSKPLIWLIRGKSPSVPGIVAHRHISAESASFANPARATHTSTALGRKRAHNIPAFECGNPS